MKNSKAIAKLRKYKGPVYGCGDFPHFRIPTRNELLARAHKGIHTVYFALVFIEGHGYYAMAGGSLFLLAVADFFLHYE